MKVLLVTNFVPYPPTSGAELRIFNLLKHIGSRHEVSLITLFDSTTGEEEGAAHLEPFCTRVELVARRQLSMREGRLRLARGILRAEPRLNAVSYFEEMADRIRNLTETEPFDIVQIHHAHMAPYVEAISPHSHCRKILFLHNIPHIQYRRMVSFERNWRVRRKLLMNWLFSKRATLNYARRFDKCIVVSELDGDILREAEPDLDIAVLPGGVDTNSYPLLNGQPTTPTLLFVGNMQYAPNVDGALFFFEEILPLIKRQVPETRLLIVGRRPTNAVQALASEDVIVTGHVDSVFPYYEQAVASLVPLRAGGGTRLKIPEFMALGRPVISTTLGCEGLAVTHNENILIANTPVEFSEQTIRLLSDEQLRQRLIVNGRRLVETTYDWGAIAGQLLQIYDETISKPL